MICLSLSAYDFPPAFRAAAGEFERAFAARMILVVYDFYYFGNHISAALDQHPIPDLHSEALDFILIVQRCALDRGAADGHWPQRRQRRELAGASHLHQNVLD